MNTKEKNVEQFQEHGYCVLEKAISQDILDIITQYALFDEMQNFSPEISRGKIQVPNAHSAYGDPAMESMLLYLQKIIEDNTGLSLSPTYSYYRVYRPGDELANHRDRKACEISATLCFNFDYVDHNFTWPIYVGDKKIEQISGDIAIYRGCEIYHRRDKFLLDDNDAWHVQGFFHYVDANGPYADEKFDKRASIGTIIKGDVTQSPKSYIEYTK